MVLPKVTGSVESEEEPDKTGIEAKGMGSNDVISRIRTATKDQQWNVYFQKKTSV